MWLSLCLVLLIVESLALALFIFLTIKTKRTIKVTAMYFTLAIIFGFLLYGIPLLYNSKNQLIENYSFETLRYIFDSIMIVIFSIDIDAIGTFSMEYPIYIFTYSIGVLFAFSATITTVITAFKNVVSNNYYKHKYLNLDSCDIIIGNNPEAIAYKKRNVINKEKNTYAPCVFWIDENVSKEDEEALLDDGYVLLRAPYTKKTFNSKVFNNHTKYNFIYFDDDNDEKYLDFLNEFIEATSDKKGSDNLFLYLELKYEKTSVIRKIVINPSNKSSRIITFSRYEMLARNLLENYPIIDYLPRDFIEEDTSIKPDKVINIFILGFGWVQQELFKQMLINNQLATRKHDTYECYQINYHIYDNDSSKKDSSFLRRMNEHLSNINFNDGNHLDKPDNLGNIIFHEADIEAYETLLSIKKEVSNENSFNYIYISYKDDFGNILLSTNIYKELDKMRNYQMFVRTNHSYTSPDKNKVTYYGDYEKLLCHKNIINDELSIIAKLINYKYGVLGNDERLCKLEEKYKNIQEDKVKKTQLIVDEFWKLETNPLNIYSNVYAALNFKTKLFLLGYKLSDKKEESIPNEELKKIFSIFDDTIDEKSVKQASIINACIAQEHYRWNAYNLVNDIMPREIYPLKIKENKNDFDTKGLYFNKEIKSNVCITTYDGLEKLIEEEKKIVKQENLKNENFNYYSLYTKDLFLLQNALEFVEIINKYIAKNN